MEKRPSPLQAILHILSKLIFVKPLEQERLGIVNGFKLIIHIVQRMVRLLLTPFLRIVVKHPLGWPLPQELLCTLMFGILQSRQVSAWRGFFSAVGDLAAWVPVHKQQLATGSCSSVWVRLPPEKQPQQPRASINLVFFHGGAFVAGDALMYLATYAYWLQKLAAAGISCNILSVDYPLAPEHPFPAAVESAADVIEWLAKESGEAAPYIVAGDSAGGNLVLTGLGLLKEQGRLAALPSLPEALVLLSPAVDMSNASVFARGEPVSSHIDADSDSSAPPSAAVEAAAGARAGGSDVKGGPVSSHIDADNDSSAPAAAPPPPPAATAAADVMHVCGVRSEPVISHRHADDDNCASAAAGMAADGERTVDDTTQQQQQQQPHTNSTSTVSSYASFVDLKQHIHQHHHEQQHLSKQQQRQHQVGGPAGPLQLIFGLAGEVKAAWKAHRSKAGAAAAAAAGWFDYLPGSSVADNIHHYLHDPALLCHPLVSPTLLPCLTGLSKQGMLVVAGGAELMRPDIAAFAAKAKAAGVAVQYHEEAGECHCYAVLALPHLLQKSHMVLDYVEKVALAPATAPAPAATAQEPAAAATTALAPATLDQEEVQQPAESSSSAGM